MTQKNKSIPDDLTLLRTCHIHDLPRIAAAARLEDLEQAARWAVQSLPGNSPRRRVIHEAIASRKGGRP